jgi:arylsulfatase A-like enzyme/cytochrome c-type biogenesis protein CcmH/NrfG
MVHFSRMRISRRSLAAALGIAVLVVLGAWYWLRARSQPADGPVILISIDTLRADHLPAYGYQGVRTPNIDALAATGTLFERAYSHAPQTLPAHTSILTGRLPFETGVRDNIGFTLEHDAWTLPGALREKGYSTAGFVSAYVLRKATGIDSGFDTYDADLPPASPEVSLGQVQRDGAQTLQRADAWLHGRKNDRFFLFVHFYEPHKPYAPPSRFSQYQPYDGEIAYADELVGRLMDRLRSEGLFDKAIVILLSDHGEGLGDHGEQEHGMFLYQSTTHIPLIVKVRGERAGRRVTTPAQHIDIAPTVLDLIGAPIAASLRGRSLRPLLDGSGNIEETGIYAEALTSRYHFGWSELYSLTDSRYRFIRAPREELYDLRDDPDESSSRASDRPQVRQAMRGALDRLLAGSSLGAPADISREDRARLAALGYVGTGSATSLALPGDQLPDPKDKIGVLAKYQRATELAAQSRWGDAIAAYRQVLADDPEMADVWSQLAQAYLRREMTAEAVDAYKEIIRRNPKDAGSLIGITSALIQLGRLDDAQKYAELAQSVAPAPSHELLAKVAVQRRDRPTAMREAALAQQADPTLPATDLVDGMLLYNEGRYADALRPLMAARDAQQRRTLQTPDLNYYIGDSLARLERYPEAEAALLAEVRMFPFNTRARAGLAMLYRATGRDAESDRAIAELLRMSPDGEGRRLAIQLWTMFGEPQKAESLKDRPRN